MLDARVGTSRRDVLLSVAALTVASPLLGACDLLGKHEPPPPDPLTDFYTATLALAALYDGAVATNPQLTPVRDAHRAHAVALAAIMKPTPASNTPAAAASASAGATPAELRVAEQRGYQKAIEVCATAPANRATLLGEIAAARGCHLEVLP